MNLIKKINTCCFLCILFFMLFECLIGHTVLEPMIRLRTASYLFLFISTFFVFRKKLPRLCNVSFIFFVTYYVIVGVFDFFAFLNLKNINGFIVYKQMFLFLLLFYVYYFLEETSTLTYSKAKKYLVIFAGCFVVINMIGYFIDSPIWQDPRVPGRIGRGYATLDVITLTYSYIILLMDDRLRLNCKLHFVLMLLIPIGIISLASGTGMFTLGLTVVIFLLSCLRTANFYDKMKNQFLQSMIILSVLLAIGWGILLREAPIVAETLVSNVENRIGVMLEGKKYEGEINTVEWREDQYDYITKKFFTSHWDNLFGIGFSKVNFSDTRDSNSVYIENQYNLNLVTLGIVGSVLFIFSLLEICFRAYKLSANPRRFMYYVAMMIFAASCYTIVPMQTFSVLSYFSLFLAMFYRESRKYC